VTKKSIALLMAMTLVGGLFAAALATTSQAARAKTFQTEFTTFKFKDGKFVGRIAGKRWLCLSGRDVHIVKVDGAAIDNIVATLHVRDWSTGEAKFSAAHPAMDISNRRRRNRALHGSYVAKFVEAPVATGYGRAGLCLGDKTPQVEI
jgi:hypothetical protein